MTTEQRLQKIAMNMFTDCYRGGNIVDNDTGVPLRPIDMTMRIESLASILKHLNSERMAVSDHRT